MNNQIFFFFYNLAHQSQIVDKIVIFFAVYFPYLVIILAGIFLLFHHEVLPSKNPLKEFVKKWKEILLVFFSGVLAYVLAQVLKFFVHAPRPFEVFPQVHSLFFENGFSFPSGHATFFSALALSLFFAHKKTSYVFMFFALVIGIARIIAGVHFPIDILGGFILGVLVAFFVEKFF